MTSFIGTVEDRHPHLRIEGGRLRSVRPQGNFSPASIVNLRNFTSFYQITSYRSEALYDSVFVVSSNKTLFFFFKHTQGAKIISDMKNPHKAISNCTGSTINFNVLPHHPNPTETKDTANKYRRVSLAQSKIRSIYSTVSKLPEKTIAQIGKTMTCLVLFIFAMNVHFILFLRLKKINVITFDSYYLNNATRENYSRVKTHHSFECSSDRGT